MSQIQQIKDLVAIEDLIGERIHLNRSGTYYRGLCPFHSEKSPSFFVSPQMQRFKCFGCAATGDAFEFLQRYEGLTFYEALQLLAERTGVTLESASATPADQQRERLREILNLAKEYYHFLLTTHESGQQARLYLKNRGVTQEPITIFQLGYALPSWDGIIKYLNGKKRYSLEELSQAGLIVTNERKRQYDRFRDRLIFPLNDARGKVVGFSGRVLDPEIKTAKYINSPETEFYHKSQLLYGFSELFQEIRKKAEIIVVEGELDVISSAQAHVNNIVAIKGSALTPDHARIMHRVVDRVILALDADDAGIEATKRAIPICTQEGLELRIIKVPEGKDPDELAQKKPDLWRKTADQSLSVYAYLLDVALNRHPKDTPEGQRKIIDELAPVFAHITHAVEKEFYVKKLAEALGVRLSIIQSDIEKFGSKATRLSRLQKTNTDAAPIETLTHRQKLARFLWHLWLSSDQDVRKQRWLLMQEMVFQTPLLQRLLNQLSQYSHSNQDKTQDSLFSESWIQQLPSDVQQALFDIWYDPSISSINKDNGTDQWLEVRQNLQKLMIQESMTAITEELDQLDTFDSLTPEQEKRQQQLLQEIVMLRKSFNSK